MIGNLILTATLVVPLAALVAAVVLGRRMSRRDRAGAEEFRAVRRQARLAAQDTESAHG
jgi:hypothetical protein